MAFGQITRESPTISYVSLWELETLLVFDVGQKILFKQNCSKNIPENVINGTVYFENVKYNKSKLKMLIEFRDTSVHSVLYSFNYRNYAILEKIGCSKETVTILKKNEFVAYSKIDDYTIFILKKGRKIHIHKVKCS